jgi:hypothetical protein
MEKKPVDEWVAISPRALASPCPKRSGDPFGAIKEFAYD